MRKIFLLSFLSLIVSVSLFAQGKFETAMKNNIALMDTAKTGLDWQNIESKFVRIAEAEKNQWLPYYYAAYCNIILTYYEKSNEKKDLLLDNADKFIAIADSLEPKNSELYTLKAFSAEMRISVDPMGRYMKYGAIFDTNLKVAMELDPTNPRPEMLKGQMVLYTPEQFGGGYNNAKPILESSLEKFEKFTPKSEIHPNWGKEVLKMTLDNKGQF